MQQVRRKGVVMEYLRIADLRWIFTFSVLLLLAAQDIAIQKIDVRVILVSGLAAVLINILSGEDIVQLGYSCVPGILLTVLGKLTSGIGSGDSWLLFAIGQLLGGSSSIAVLLYASIGCLFSMLIMKKRRQAFVPWLLAGCYIQWVLATAANS